jgi:hypothetical protein
VGGGSGVCGRGDGGIVERRRGVRLNVGLNVVEIEKSSQRVESIEVDLMEVYSNALV